MQKSCYGFSLISLLIYLTASMIMIALLFKGVASLYPRLLTCGRRTQSYLKSCTALDTIARDLYSAPHDESAWNVVRDDEIAWICDKKRTGWCYKKNRLIRMEGSYDEKKNRWRTKAKSVAADSLSECSFFINRSGGRIVGLTVVLATTDNGQTVKSERTIALRTGGVYETGG